VKILVDTDPEMALVGSEVAEADTAADIAALARALTSNDPARSCPSRDQCAPFPVDSYSNRPRIRRGTRRNKVPSRSHLLEENTGRLN